MNDSSLLLGCTFTAGAVTAWALLRLWNGDNHLGGHGTLAAPSAASQAADTIGWNLTLHLKIRPLAESDFDKEFIPLLNQLSTVGSVSRDVRFMNEWMRACLSKISCTHNEALFEYANIRSENYLLSHDASVLD